MKKILILTTAILIISTNTNACEGIIIKDKYCLSPHTMNWYSAVAWCTDQEKKLLDFTTFCNTVELSTCSEFKLTDEEKTAITDAGGKVSSAWTNVSESVGRAFVMNLGYAMINVGYRYQTALALCQ